MNEINTLDMSVVADTTDCVQFKRKLQENAWKNSGATTYEEYVAYVEKSARESKYWKKPLNS